MNLTPAPKMCTRTDRLSGSVRSCSRAATKLFRRERGKQRYPICDECLKSLKEYAKEKIYSSPIDGG